MVSQLSIAFMVISLLVCFLLPIGLGIFMYKKEKISIKAIFVGALVFFVFQMITRIPLLQFLSTQSWYIEASKNKWFLALFLGLSAGIFEEVGRFLGFKYLLKNKLEWKNGIAFGIGHGGIEAIGLVGLTLINNLVFAVMINSGKLDAIFGNNLPQATIDNVKNVLINTPSPMFLMTGVEKTFAIAAQIGFSMLVLYGVKNRKNIYLLYAILLHAIMDAPILLTKNVVALEVYFFLFAVVSVVLTVRSRRIFEDKKEDVELINS